MSQQASVLGIVGSYRKDGTIDTVISEVLSGAQSKGAKVEKFYLSDLNIGFCTNCRGCMQDAGVEHVPCVVHHDDMEPLLRRIASSDAIVIGAPVNAGSANALTQRLVERCAGFFYWPWGAQRGPHLRNEQKSKQAILVSSSAAPAIMNNAWFGFGAVGTLKFFAHAIGAEVEDIIKVGMVVDRGIQLSDKTRRTARESGERLAETGV